MLWTKGAGVSSIPRVARSASLAFTRSAAGQARRCCLPPLRQPRREHLGFLESIASESPSPASHAPYVPSGWLAMLAISSFLSAPH
ncbi:hypothetical protein U5640_43980 [Streptomyces sp. SS7]|uniref:hypothetical protein n=1 Tax=Streptomyces sp. SS7 TaxID=3108485 RepID=UPI0030EDEC7E